MSRRAQPYRKGSRSPSPALTAMLRGRSFDNAPNAADSTRAVQRMISAGKQRPARPARPVRPERPPRPPRPQ